MAVCTPLRVDSTDFNTSGAGDPKYACMITAIDRRELMFAWGEFGLITDTFNTSIHFRNFSTATSAFGTEIVVHARTGGTTADKVDHPYLVRLTSGRLLCCYGHGSSASAGIFARTSADHGATWSVTTALGMPTSVLTFRISGLVTDGADAWVFGVNEAGGFGAGDAWVKKYTASSDTWAASWTLIYNSGGIGGTPGALTEFDVVTEHTGANAVMFDSLRGVVVFNRCIDGTSTLGKATAFYTTDGWTTTGIVDIYNAGVAYAPDCELEKDSATQRVYATYRRDNPTRSIISDIYMAYSDDYGATWTNAGIVQALRDEADGGTYTDTGGVACLGNDHSMHIDSGGLVYLSGVGQWNAAHPEAEDYNWTIFRAGQPSGAAFDLVHECFAYDTASLVRTTWGISSFKVTPDGSYHLVQAVPVSSANRLYLLEAPDITESVIIPTTEAAESGFDENSLYLRRDFFDGRGWSAHDHAVACWAVWPEGSYVLGREVPIVITGNPSMDPGTVAVENLIAFWHLDDPGQYTKQEFWIYEGSAMVIQGDPLNMLVYTKEFTIAQPFERNIARAGLISYRRAVDPFEIEVWTDGKIHQVTTIQPSWPEPADYFFPLNPFDNVGATVQFKVSDRSEFPLEIHALGLVLIRKKLRG